MKPNPNKKWEIIYPENSSAIITKLMEKYELKETPNDVLEKMERNEITIGEIIAGIVAKAAKEEGSVESIASALKQSLNLTKETAEALAEDLKKEILVFVEKIPIKEEKIPTPEKKEEITPSKKPKIRPQEIEPQISPEKPTKRPPKQDTYREPIE